MAEVGRNEPCLCGSGKKFKKCCGVARGVEIPSETSRALSLHQRDQQLVEEILRFARKRFGAGWLAEVAATYFNDFAEGDHEVQLLVPWAVYHFEKDGQTAARLFLYERSRHVSDEARGWLEAQGRAWLSVWEVLEVEAGIGVSVRDLLTREQRFVYEVKGSKLLKPRDCVLGRVVDHGGVSTFCGMHPRSLPPREAEFVVQEGRRLCRVRTRPADPAKLRGVDSQLDLIDAWHACVEKMDRPKPFPKLTNTDGDPFLLTTDHFDFRPEERDRIVSELQKLEGAQEPIEENGEVEVPFIKLGNAQNRSWENTVIGRVVVRDSRLKIETNSITRADILRARVESALDDRVHHRLREHADMEALSRSTARSRKKMEEPPAELKAMLRDFKEKHMAQWLDDEIPALDGLTPREAVKKAGPRAKLDLLLRDMENRDARLPEEDRFDYSRLRTELGLNG